MEKLEQYSLKMLLTTVFGWAYDHDLDLYKNLDHAFSAFDSRSGISNEQGKIMNELEILNDYTALELLEKAITLADYQDTLKFSHAFSINNHSTNKGHGSYEWKFDSFKPHPYSTLIPLISKRMKVLEEKGLASWHHSDDHEKHHHFRYWMNEFLRDDKRFSLRLFVVNTGNTRSFDTLHIGTNESETYQEIIKYILEQNICPDPHHKKIEVPDFVNPDNYNKRYIESSGQFGGFWHLVYLTADELREIYQTKIKKRKLNYMEKAYWAFINACSKDNETKFYLFLT